MSYGLQELLRNNAANSHSNEDWNVVFTLLKVAGAVGAQGGAVPCPGEEEES